MKDWGVSDYIAGGAALAAFLQFIVLFLTIYALRKNMKITECAYISGGGYFLGDPTTGWRGDTFQLTIDNYGKTPAFVTYADIGYWWLRDGPRPIRRPAQSGMS